MQPSLLKAGLAALILVAGAPLAGAQQAPGAAVEFTTERRDALRRTWQSDPAIRDHVGPGDADRLDASSDFYAEDSTARQSLAPAPATAEGADVAVATGRETRP